MHSYSTPLQCPADSLLTLMSRGDTDDWGITDSDRAQFRRFLSKSYFERTPDDLRPGEDDAER